MYRGKLYEKEKKTGKDAENQFELWLQENGIEYSRSTWSADYYGHVDFILKVQGEWILIDVKSNKFQKGEEKMACFELEVSDRLAYDHYNTRQGQESQYRLGNPPAPKYPNTKPSNYIQSRQYNAKYDYMVFMMDGVPRFVQRHNDYLYNVLIEGITANLRDKGLNWWDVAHQRGTAGFFDKKPFHVYPNQNQIVEVWLTYIPYDYMKHYMMDWHEVAATIAKEQEMQNVLPF